MAKIADTLDDIERKIRSQNPEIGDATIRQTSLAVATFLRKHNLTGLSNDAEYRDMKNNFLGIALQDPAHPSLPLISCVIFCSLMMRFGIEAHCCGMPSHVHAMVLAPEGQTLDGRVAEEGAVRDMMYLDPFNHGEEVHVGSLERILNDWGVHQVDYKEILVAPQHTSSVVSRTAQNILATIQAFRTTMVNTSQQTPSLQLHSGEGSDLEHSFYAALWAKFMLVTSDPWHQRQRRQLIPLLVEKFESQFPSDISLIEKYVCPISSMSFVL
jgi:F-box protein 21